MLNPAELGEKLIEVGSSLYRSGMLAGTDGNLSARIDDQTVLITRSGVAKGRLKKDDFVTVDLSGRVVNSKYKPSTEAAMHLTVYNERPDVWACVHSHPPFSTSFAVAGIKLERNVLPEVAVFVGDIPLIEYAPPGIGAISKAIKPHLRENNAFLLRNHGLLTIGKSVEQAFHRHETVEHYARIMFLALRLGNVNTIPSEELKRLDEMRRQKELVALGES
jgi:L-fuculose-phosphate aldolase